MTITLFNNESQPVCERLVFIDNHSTSKAPVRMEIGKEAYTKREKASIRLDQAQGVDSASLSMAIVRDGFEDKGRFEKSKSYLLLNSDLPGEVEDAAQYFDYSNPDRLAHLDVLLMTQGWRRVFYIVQYPF